MDNVAGTELPWTLLNSISVGAACLRPRRPALRRLLLRVEGDGERRAMGEVLVAGDRALGDKRTLGQALEGGVKTRHLRRQTTEEGVGGTRTPVEGTNKEEGGRTEMKCLLGLHVGAGSAAGMVARMRIGRRQPHWTVEIVANITRVEMERIAKQF